MNYLYQHRFTFWNLAKLKTVKTAWFDRNEAQVDILDELNGGFDLEDWLSRELEMDIYTIIEMGLYQLETRTPRYDEEVLEAAV
jgi:hypothetical protein